MIPVHHGNLEHHVLLALLALFDHRVILSRKELFDEVMTSLDARVCRPVDEQYFCPGLAWLKEFASQLKEHAPEFRSEAFDCDQFALRARVQADEALLRGSQRDSGHTFGYAEVMMQAGMVLNGIEAPSKGAHATNLCRLNDGTWWFVEPQTNLMCRWDQRPRGLVLAFLWL